MGLLPPHMAKVMWRALRPVLAPGPLATRTGSACALQPGFLAGRLAGEPRSVSFGVRENWGVWEGMHKIPVLPSEDRRASA